MCGTFQTRADQSHAQGQSHELGERRGCIDSFVVALKIAGIYFTLWKQVDQLPNGLLYAG